MKQYSKRKQIFSILLSAILVIASFPLSPITLFAEDELTTGSCGENVTYSFDSTTGTLTISGTGDMYDYNTGDYGDSPFKNSESIVNVLIEEGVTSVGTYAFNRNRTALKSVTIPGSVVKINQYAFSECDSLEEVVLNDGINTIDDHAFYMSGIREVNIPSSVSTVGEDAFSYCQELTTATIGGGVQKMGHVFNHCRGLETVTLSEGITELAQTFVDCTKLKSINLPDTLSILRGAFDGCNSLESIVIPQNVHTITGTSFTNCSNLNEITILADNLFSIEVGAFLTTGYYNDETNWDNGVLYIDNILIASKTNLAGDYKIKDGTTYVADSAFKECSNIVSITFPDSVKRTAGCVSYCDNLEKIVILNPDMIIAGDAFYNQNGKLPAIAGYIGSTAETYANSYVQEFVALCTDGTENHDYMQTYVTGDDDKTYCRYTCSLCGYSYDELAENIVFGKCGENAEYILDKNTGIVTVSGDGAMNDYNSTDNKSPFADYTDVIQTVIIENGITTVGDNMFNDCALLDVVNLPESITSIGNASFCRCTALETITVPDSVAAIGDSAFEGCTALLYINFPDNITSIGASAFKDCTALTDITMLPAKLQSLGANAFENCRSLKSLSIPDSLTVIPDAAFKECETLTGNLNIPHGVTAIGSEAFSGCANITSVTVSDSVTSIGASCFNECTGLEKITILNKACDIDNASETIPDTATIYGFYQSTPQQYAETYNRNFVTLCNDGTEEHTFDETSTATCTEDGIKTYTCSVCGYTYDEEQEALEHIYEAGETVAPTCTEEGYTVYTCSRCDDTYNGDATEPMGHSFINYVSNEDAACTENGTETAVCENGCSETDTRLMEGSALGHTYEAEVVAPTYDAEGYTVYTCSRCGDTYKTDFTDKLVKDEPKSEEEEKEEYQGPHSTDYERFRIIPGRGQIKVAWSIDEQMSGYEILFSTDGSNYQALADIKVTDSSYYIIHGLQPGQNYYIKLQAYCMFGDEKIIMDEESVLKNVTVKR